MANPDFYESSGESKHPTRQDLVNLYRELLLTHGLEKEVITKITHVPKPKRTGKAVLRGLMSRDKTEEPEPEPAVTKATELSLSLLVLPANERHSERGGSLVLQQGDEGVKLFVRIGRTIYNPRPSSEMDHIHSAVDLDKELSLDDSPDLPCDPDWYEYLRKVDEYLTESQSYFSEGNYKITESLDAKTKLKTDFLTQNYDLIARVEAQLGANNPAADHFPNS